MTNTGIRIRRIMVRILGMVHTLKNSLRIFSFKRVQLLSDE